MAFETSLVFWATFMYAYDAWEQFVLGVSGFERIGSRSATLFRVEEEAR